MKKIGILVVVFALSLCGFAQVNDLLETTVHSPLFEGEKGNVNESLSLNDFIVDELKDQVFITEGVVEILFTVNADGSVSDIAIKNSVSKTEDNAVINCIEKTSGKWLPGEVDGVPVAMEKRLYVNFLDLDNVSLQEQARDYLGKGLKNYFDALNTEKRFDLDKDRAEKKANRKYNTALLYFNEAHRCCPQEISIPFWQACIYEKTGNDGMYIEKFNEFNEKTIARNNHAYEFVSIATKTK